MKLPSIPRYLMFYATILALMPSCKDAQETVDESLENWDWSKAVFYEIFIQSFADSNGDGIGDIAGATTKLDYLKDLGIDAVWLMPISPSPSYHKYDVTDYRDIHPDYGTMDDFKHFLKEAHKRDIKVVIDMVINHSSSKHSWFLNAKKGPKSKYRDYYVWADKDSIAAEMEKQEASFDSGNLQQWHPVDGDKSAAHYYGFFYGGMPDLNYDSPNLREEIYDIGRFWLTEVGVDGFRLDAAKHIYPDDRLEDNHAFWIEFKSKMESYKPNAYLIGEVWADVKTAAPYAAGLTSLFNFDRAFSILESVRQSRNVTAIIEGPSFKNTDSLNLVEALKVGEVEFAKYNQGFFEANFLSNHDQNRVASFLKSDPNKLRTAASILFTLKGTPYIYYGEEIGMTGMKPDENIREPFLWDEYDLDDERTTWLDPVHSKESTIVPAAKQRQDSSSLLNHYRDLIALRKSNQALTSGSIELSDINHNRVLSYIRLSEEDSVFVVHNLGKQPLSFASQHTKEYQSLIWVDGEVTNNDGTFQIGGRSSAIYSK